LERLQGSQEEEGVDKVALTRDFAETVKARAERDPEFRRGLLIEALELLIANEVDAAKTVLRDYINATVGFKELAEATNKQPKSLMRMLSPNGNPTVVNMFSVIASLQQREGVRLGIKARSLQA
jgi:DNA-binding phage protein